MIIVKLQTCLSDKSNFPFKNLFFNCYFFICSKFFSVVSECFIHNIATLLYLPQKIHRLPIAHCLTITHCLPTTHRPPAHRPPSHRPKIPLPAHRPSPGNILYFWGGVFLYPVQNVGPCVGGYFTVDWRLANNLVLDKQFLPDNTEKFLYRGLICHVIIIICYTQHSHKSQRFSNKGLWKNKLGLKILFKQFPLQLLLFFFTCLSVN